MIASLANLVFALAILVGIGYVTIKYLVPYAKSLRVEEERVRKHEAWLHEQHRLEQNLRDAARKEVEKDLGPVDVGLGDSPPIHDEKQ